MDTLKISDEELLEISRRKFLKNSAAVAIGLGAMSLLGLPELALGREKIAVSALALAYPWGAVAACGNGSYNLLSGNNTISHVIAAGVPLDFVVYHNSGSAISSGPLGPKWTHSYSANITTATGTATYNAADGTAWTFTQSGSSYIAPVGCWKSLVLNTGGTWTLTDLQGTLSLNFLSSGLLNNITNTLTSAVVLQCNYTSGHLTSVQSGPYTLTLGYTGSLITSVTDINGYVHTLGYTSGALTSHSMPTLGGVVHQTLFAYNSGGIVNQVTDFNGNAWGYTYNSSAQLTGTTDPIGNTGSYLSASSNPSPSGWPSDVVSAGVVTSPAGSYQYGFDSSGRVVAYAGFNGDAAVYNYNSTNSITSKTLSVGGTWSWTYDSVGRLLTETNPSGVEASLTLDSAGRVTSSAYGGITPFTVAYDTSSNVIQQSITGGDTYALTYDSNFNLLTMSDSTSGLGLTCTYDSSGDLLTYTNLLGHETTFTYTSGLLTSFTDARGRVSNITRDAWGRMTLAQFPTTSNPNKTWGFDASSNVTSASTAAGSYSTVFNTDGLITSATGPAGTASTAYNSTLQPSSVTDTTGRSHSFTWNSNYAATGISISGGGGSIGYTYNSNNQVTSCSLPNGTKINYGYDSNSRLNSISYVVTSTSALIVSYAAVFSSTTGLVTQITEEPSGAVTTFTYDSRGRCTHETRTGTNPYTGVYTYNAIGQILSAVRSENGVVSHNGAYTYSGAGLLTLCDDSATGINESYTWYNDGSLATFPGPSYTRQLDYYEDGKLLSISRNSGSGPVLAYKFFYDPDGSLAYYNDYVLNLTTQYSLGVGFLQSRLLVVNQGTLGGSLSTIGEYTLGLKAAVALAGAYFADSFFGTPQVATNSSAASSGSCLVDFFGVYRTPFGTGTLAAYNDLPGVLNLDGITFGIEAGTCRIRERYLTVSAS